MKKCQVSSGGFFDSHSIAPRTNEYRFLTAPQHRL